MRKALSVSLALLGGAAVARSSCVEGGEDGVCDASAMVQTRHKASRRLAPQRDDPQVVPMCRPGDDVYCLGTNGTKCAGNQCCPGTGGSPTYPCPSADVGFGEGSCGTSTKIVNCLPNLGGIAPRISGDRQKSLNSVPYLIGKGVGSGQENGKIKIDVDGEIQEYWLPGANTEDNDTTVKYEPPYRFYLMNKYTTDYSNADDFVYLPYIGKTFSVDFYFGPDGPGCGCNLNFYLVQMPAALPGNEKDYYCDAQCFDGLGCCSEFDMNEGNMEVQQITNHACTDNYADHPDWKCNKWGDPEQKTTEAEFSPGAGHTIDSTQKFTWQSEFREENGQAIMTTRIIQGSKVVTKTMGPGSDQLNSMFKDIEAGMAFVTGYWFASDMNWLDGDECGGGAEKCDMKPAYLSNWKLTSNGDVPTLAPTIAPPTEKPSTAGKCCWNSCGDSCGAGIEGWCNGSTENCEQCGGGIWCN